MATTQPVPRPSPTASFVRSARGGVSVGAVLTGMVVSFGAMSLLSAIVAGVISLGLPEDTPFPGSEIQGTLFAGIVLAITQFLAYLWGGYTAGRMARGSGLANGLLVPLVAILLLAVVGAIVAAFTSATTMNPLPFQEFHYDFDADVMITWGAGIGIATVLAMFAGGGVGGVMGARWHTRLEQEAAGTEAPAPSRADS